MDRTMAKRKMLLKKMLNGHHIGAVVGGRGRAVPRVLLSVENPGPGADPRASRRMSCCVSSRLVSESPATGKMTLNPREADAQVARNRSVTSGYSSVSPGL